MPYRSFHARLLALAFVVAAFSGCAKEKSEVKQASTPANSAPVGATEPPPAETLLALLQPEPARAEAIESFRRARDASFVPAALDIMRLASEPSGAAPLEPVEMEAMRELTGQYLPSGAWLAWQEWSWTRARAPTHPLYPEFKRRAYARLDPIYADWLDPARTWGVDPAEIILLPGRRRVDFPDLATPLILAADAPETAGFSGPAAVAGIEIGAQRRAYPLNLLKLHGVVNDTLAGLPIVVAYHPLNRAVYALTVRTKEGAASRFRMSSLLHRGEMLLADEDSGSLWSSRTGDAVAGPAARGEGRIAGLQRLPVTQTVWNSWVALWPDTSTVGFDPEFQGRYVRPDPFDAYHRSPDTIIPLRMTDSRRAAKDRVFGVSVGAESLAIALADLPVEGTIKERVGGEKLFIRFQRANEEFRAYRVGGLQLESGDSPWTFRDPATDSTWRLMESAIVMGDPEGVRPEGIRLEWPRVWGEVTYWHLWSDRHPETRIHEPGRTIPAGANRDPH